MRMVGRVCLARPVRYGRQRGKLIVNLIGDQADLESSWPFASYFGCSPAKCVNLPLPCAGKTITYPERCATVAGFARLLTFFRIISVNVCSGSISADRGRRRLADLISSVLWWPTESMMQFVRELSRVKPELVIALPSGLLYAFSYYLLA